MFYLLIDIKVSNGVAQFLEKTKKTSGILKANA